MHFRQLYGMLFIDNYHPSPKEFTLDVSRYEDRLIQQGFGPHIVTYESMLDLPARNLLQSLNEDAYRLDAALYVAKFSLFELVITTLFSSYKSQQASVRRVLRALGYTHLPIINIYFNDDRQITVGMQS